MSPDALDANISRLRVPVSRAHALSRSLVSLTPAVVLGLIILSVWANWILGATRTISGIVDYCLLLVLIPLAIAGLLFALSGLRWFLVFTWPGFLGLHADSKCLQLVGPFRRRVFPIAGVQIAYGFEWPMEERAQFVEALLPDDEQVSSYLPRIRDLRTGADVNLLILQYLGRTESYVASELLPFIRFWRLHVLETGWPVEDDE